MLLNHISPQQPHILPTPKTPPSPPPQNNNQKKKRGEEGGESKKKGRCGITEL